MRTNEKVPMVLGKLPCVGFFLLQSDKERKGTNCLCFQVFLTDACWICNLCPPRVSRPDHRPESFPPTDFPTTHLSAFIPNIHTHWLQAAAQLGPWPLARLRPALYFLSAHATPHCAVPPLDPRLTGAAPPPAFTSQHAGPAASCYRQEMHTMDFFPHLLLQMADRILISHFSILEGGSEPVAMSWSSSAHPRQKRPEANK